jgi:hypothetical protein
MTIIIYERVTWQSHVFYLILTTCCDMKRSSQSYTTNEKNKIWMHNHKTVTRCQCFLSFRCMYLRVSPSCILKEQCAVLLCTKQLTTIYKESEAFRRARDKQKQHCMGLFFSGFIRSVFVANEFFC